TVTLTVRGKQVPAIAMEDVKGTLPPSVISGRAPTRADEILAAPKTLDAIGAHVGDVVDVRGAVRSEQLRIVGKGVVAESLFNRLGEGTALTFQALRRLDPKATRSQVHIRIAPGVDRRAAIAHFERLYQTDGPVRPVDVGNFGGITGVPAAVAII